MPGKTLKEAFGELTIAAEPTSFPSTQRAYFQEGPNGLRIMWRYNGFNWEGRCISPRIVNGAPTMASIVNNEIAINVNGQTTYYISAGAGTTTWFQFSSGGGWSGGGGS